MTQAYTHTRSAKPALPLVQDLSPVLANTDPNRQIVASQFLDLQDAGIQGNSLIIPENPESGQVAIQATQAAQVPAFCTTEEVVRQFQLLIENVTQINTRLAVIDDRLVYRRRGLQASLL